MEESGYKGKYRKFSYISDFPGIKTSLFDMMGKGFPRQPELNQESFIEHNNEKYDESWFIDIIKDKVATHPANRLEYPFADERIFDEPIIGFVSGNDPIFQEYKSVIGPFHLTPAEVMAWQAKKNGVVPPLPEDLSVVSYILPIASRTKEDNAQKTDWLAERWAQTRRSGEIFNQIMGYQLVSYLMARGILAVVPDMTPLFHYKKYPDTGWASPWSQRHIAYAAGLGTFGMSDLLITEKGVAHRCGSLVVNLKLNPNRERNRDIHADCLQYQGIQCLACQRRCPVAAISSVGHAKNECGKKVIDSIGYCNRNYHIFIYGCGLCSTGIPCESGIPGK